MTRMTQLVSALSLSAVLAAVAVGACGGRAPGEMPPVAPRPSPMTPGNPAAKPLTPTLMAPGDGGGAPMTPGPVSVRAVPTPEFAAAGAADAGVALDSYAPPLPPIPDGGVIIDGRSEPK